MKDLVGKPRTLDDGRPGGFYVPRFRNLKDKQQGFIRGYGFEGGSGAGMFPEQRRARPASAPAYKKTVRDVAGATIGHGRLRRGAAPLRERRELDPEVKDQWGIPVLRFDFKFGDNEKKMAADMADTAKEMFEEAGIEIARRATATSSPRAGPSTSWAPRAWATTPRRSVLNQFQQSHDVKNLFVVDGSSHVSASCQNPTWTIMALPGARATTWPTELRKGNL